MTSNEHNHGLCSRQVPVRLKAPPFGEAHSVLGLPNLILMGLLYWPMLYISWYNAGDGYRPIPSLDDAIRRIERWWLLSSAIMVVGPVSLYTGFQQQSSIAALIALGPSFLVCLGFHHLYTRRLILHQTRNGTIIEYIKVHGRKCLSHDLACADGPYYSIESLRISRDEIVRIVCRYDGEQNKVMLCNFTEDFIPVDIVSCTETTITLRMLCAEVFWKQIVGNDLLVEKGLSGRQILDVVILFRSGSGANPTFRLADPVVIGDVHAPVKEVGVSWGE